VFYVKYLLLLAFQPTRPSWLRIRRGKMQREDQRKGHLIGNLEQFAPDFRTRTLSGIAKVQNFDPQWI